MSLNLEIKNTGKETWCEVIRVKGKDCLADVDQPIAKRLRHQNVRKMIINLKKNVDYFQQNQIKDLLFELVGSDEKNNTKYFSDVIKLRIDYGSLM